ncbi:hypothetical protein [Leifsonia sp. LS-T14]|uniref:hypothetical protein n=1 Tax=unclassified Leifsonia TaxID=2663824 RepID=UPI0035A58866
MIELARLACLPWGMAGMIKPDTEGGPAKAELLALIALTMAGGDDDGSAAEEVPNSLYEEAHEWADAVGRLISLSQARHLLEVRSQAPTSIDRIAMFARTREVWLRSTSYPDMLEKTQNALLGHGPTAIALAEKLGFDASDALAVLNGLHQIQVDEMNERMEAGFGRLADAAQAGVTSVDSETVKQVRESWNLAWQPTADRVAVSPAAVAESVGRDVVLVKNVLEWFSVEIQGLDARSVLNDFVGGDNPLRTNPVVRAENDRYMLVHDALVLPAIRENLEQMLKTLPVWEEYQKWRGDLLEQLGREALSQLIPGSEVYSAFEYFVPAEGQDPDTEPARYAKKVEGDLLFVLDDVAVIVEAKAVAITPAARAGETRRLRRNLIDIITKASDQASRLQDRIEGDGGVRIHGEGWIDLSDVREIHTVALSLEDLSGVATATADLVEAGLLDAAHIPWVLSIHDLQVITQLVDRPAEFLLYLRRRRDPEVSLAYVSPDELDLFLYFFEEGLYVAPDPAVMSAELPYMSAPRPGDIRRRAKQGRSIISSRTDALDSWHYAQLDPELPEAHKPVLNGSPMTAMADELKDRGFYGWLSAGATLLSGSTKAQADFSRIPRTLLANPRSDGGERSQTVPIGSRRSDAWLLVWMTRPSARALEDVVDHARQYLRAKKYQFKLNRGVVFVYDEGSKLLVDMVYDGAYPIPDPEMDWAIVGLRPVDKVSSPPPPKAKHRGGASANRKRKRKR